MTARGLRFATAGLLATLAACAACGGGSEVGPPPEVEATSLDPDVVALFRARIAQIEQKPRDAELRARLGMAYEANALGGAARAAYEQARRLDPREARWSYHLACVRADQGEFDAALAELDRAISLKADYAPAHSRRGDWLLELARPDEAERSYRQAVALDPGAIAPRVGMARVYLKRREEAQAVEVLEALLTALPDHPYLHQLLGTAYRQMGRMEDAERVLARAAHPQRPRWPDPWYDEIDGYKVGFAAEFQQALALLGARRHEQAIPILERLREKQPDNVVLLSNLGAAYVDTNRIDDGIRTLNAALEHSPDHFSTHLNLSAAYERLGRLKTAVEHVERAIRSNPTLGQAHFKQGLLLAKLKRFDEALAALATARRFDPRDPTSVIWSGWVRCEIGRWSDAIRDFETALALSPNDAEAHLGLALAGAEAGELARAEQALARAVELDPRHPRLPQIRRRVEVLRGGRNS